VPLAELAPHRDRLRIRRRRIVRRRDDQRPHRLACELEWPVERVGVVRRPDGAEDVGVATEEPEVGEARTRELTGPQVGAEVGRVRPLARADGEVRVGGGVAVVRQHAGGLVGEHAHAGSVTGRRVGERAGEPHPPRLRVQHLERGGEHVAAIGRPSVAGWRGLPVELCDQRVERRAGPRSLTLSGVSR